jgi:hypothetical protein
MYNRQVGWVALVSVLMSITGAPSDAEMSEAATSQGRTWKLVEEMLPEELKDVELRTDTPRHPQFLYMLAEAYPFTPPYTAEEMGYRLMEFTQRPRWSCIFANVWGSISAQGVLMNPGKSVTFMDYPEPQGVAAEFAKKPGQEMYRYLNQNTFPPDAEGSQRMTIRYRTDHQFVKKEDAFFYSPSIRRVRHQVPVRRQDKFPNQAQTTDDATGRDAWEYSWQLIGTDVLSHTVRFPVTRPTVVLGTKGDGTLREVRISDVKLMGETYPYYTAAGGVECYVVEARAREDWLPEYYAPRILYWLEKHSFYPLRIEQYGRDGKLAMVEVRLSEMFNPPLKERGYGPLFILYWDIASDLMSYNIRDNHRVKQWSAEEIEAFFNPDFMRRQWYLDLSVKSQAGVAHPDLFFLRPPLEEGKFPDLRPIQLPAEVAARVTAQEKAGRLVFEVEPAAVETAARYPSLVPHLEPEQTAPLPAEPSSDSYVQHGQPRVPTAVR